MSCLVVFFLLVRQISAASVADTAQGGQQELRKLPMASGLQEEPSSIGEGIQQLQRFGEESRTWCVGLRSPAGDWSSGVLVGGGQWILTVAHGIDDDDEAMEVFFADGATVGARVVRRDAAADLAVLRLVAVVPVAAGSGAVLTGDVSSDEEACPSDVEAYLALGFIDGVKFSGQAADQRMGFGFSRSRDGTLVTTCALGPGASGGPVFSGNGRLVGVNRTMEKSGNFATHVPIRRFFEVWPDLRGSLLNAAACLGDEKNRGSLVARNSLVAPDGVAKGGEGNRRQPLVPAASGIGLRARLARGDVRLTEVAGGELAGGAGTDAELHRQNFSESQRARRSMELTAQWLSVFGDGVPTADHAGRSIAMVGAAQFLTVSVRGCSAGRSRAMRAVAVPVRERYRG